MSEHFRLGQYTRHDRNVWYSPCGVVVTDPRAIAQLEEDYREFQRQHTPRGPRPVIVMPGSNGQGPMVRSSKTAHRTPREKRQNGRAE